MNTKNEMTDGNKGLSWEDWQERNRLQDLRGVALRARLTKYASMAILILALGFWTYAEDYRMVLGFVVCAGAIRVAFQAGGVHRYDWLILFVGIALFYNPIFPLFALSGPMAFFLVMASTTAFAASLFLLKPRVMAAGVGTTVHPEAEASCEGR